MTSHLPEQKMTVAANYATVRLFVNEGIHRRCKRDKFAAIRPVNLVSPVLEACRRIGNTATILKWGTNVARELANRLR